MMKNLFILLFAFLACAMSCQDAPTPPQQPSTPKADIDRFMKDFNKDAAMEELEQIDLVLERYQWPVTETGTGLRYWIYKKGNGRLLQKGDFVSCNYSIKLINGNEIYNSQTDGRLTFEIGNSNITPGLMEAVLLLHEGDFAKIIIPSNLGYGLAGDGNKVPPRSTLFYDLQDIKIMKIKTDNHH